MIYIKYFLGLLLLGTTIWIGSILLNHFNYYYILAILLLFIIIIIINFLFKYKKISILLGLFIYFSLPSFAFFTSNNNKVYSDWLNFNEG